MNRRINSLTDVITIDKTNENFRVLYDTSGKFVIKSIKPDEAKVTIDSAKFKIMKFKLLKVVKKAMGPNKIPYIVTNDGRTIRFPPPEIEIDDTLKYDLINNKIMEWAKMETGKKRKKETKERKDTQSIA